MNSLTSTAAGIELGSVEFDMIFDEVIDEEETMIVVFMISHGHIVAIFVESFDQLRPIEFLNKLIIGCNIDITGRQSEGSALRVENFYSGVFGTCFSTSKVSSKTWNRECLALSWLSDR